MDPNPNDKFALTRHEIGFLIDYIAQAHPVISLLMQKLRECGIPVEDPPGTAGGTANDATIHGPSP